MPDDRESDDILGILASYAPSAALLDAEWSADRKIETLAAVIGDDEVSSDDRTRPPVREVPLRFVPAGAAPRTRRRRWSSVLPIAASVAVLAVAAGILVVSSSGSDDSGSPSGGRVLGPVFDPPAGLSHNSMAATQYAYRVDQQIDLGADGRPKYHGPDDMRLRNWVSAGGDSVSIRTGQQNGCYRFPHSGPAGFEQPSRAFLAALPTNVGALNHYLRTHVQGSSSKDEAVFVAIGDMLRAADGLASPALRGASVAVLSRTPGVTVHQGQRDYLHRPAVRADFVDQRIRPGEIHSLYFNPSTFQLLEERDGSNGRPTTYSGPSPAYGAPATGQTTSPGELTGAAYVDVMTAEKIVDRLPKLPRNCHTASAGG